MSGRSQPPGTGECLLRGLGERTAPPANGSAAALCSPLPLLLLTILFPYVMFVVATLNERR